MINHMKELQVIGRSVSIDFPNKNLFCVPAKIDTGADRSAIWASDIAEKDGVLNFSLFDANSPFYTGDRISTKKFQIRSIKNSFGVTELRYVVVILVVIDGRSIRARFTLADRSKSTYPVLIGRKTLQGKFIVDVSHEPADQPKKKVLIVGTSGKTDTVNFVSAIDRLTPIALISYATYEEMIFSISNDIMSIKVGSEQTDLADFDLIHFKTSIQRDITAAFARYAKSKGVRVLDEIISFFPTTSKLYQYEILCQNDIGVPDTLFMLPKKLTTSYDICKEKLGSSFVLKDIHGKKGDYNVVINNEEEFVQFTLEAEKEERYLVAQRLVKNVGDYRVLVFGKQIPLLIYRSRPKGSASHLNNTSKGVQAKLCDVNTIPSQVQIDSIRATELLGRDIAGVDMVQDNSTGKWLCFEVNDGPQLATGAFLQEKQREFANYIQRELEK